MATVTVGDQQGCLLMSEAQIVLYVLSFLCFKRHITALTMSLQIHCLHCSTVGGGQ